MRRVGLDERVVGWILNWISDRRQRVVINGVMSGWERVESGVRSPGIGVEASVVYKSSSLMILKRMLQVRC